MKITSATVYFTSICNSGCQTCDIWKETKREEFSIQAFKSILDLPLVRDVAWTLIGGEFTVYSRYIDVIKALNDRDRDYYLISNGILPERIKSIYKFTGITNLSLSLDAYGERHDRLRGAPNNFRKIESILDWVSENHPETNLRIGYTLSNFNTREDLVNVIRFARDRELDLKVSVASPSELFFSHTTSEEIVLTTDELYKFEDLVNESDQYLQLYRAWKRGFNPKCDGIAEHLVLMYNGNVMLCENKNLVLGNILDKDAKSPWLFAADNLQKLWNSPRVKQILKEYQACNECWMSCVRKADAKRIDVSEVRRLKDYYGY